ncbi:hypothetical protein J5N97_015261 [Dioscorea zingiberensis]|uniref:DUF538 family protein n=1 Tax=Dioscorea zingiberensis TaxID=325984 RepID=A0A9D5HL01_9LILI|nr:hypothetical protein J5N97_015261 [Dioscorea zingiberensis]
MASSLFLLLLVSICSSAVSLPLPNLSTLSAYDVLGFYGFPIGLLPKGATGYDLDPATGDFSAYLNGSCSFSLEGSYQLRYQSTISGTITRNRLYNLKGVSVKFLLFWINIIEVTRRDDVLEFSVGIASADFPVDNFYECPQCGCGLDCVGDGRDGARIKLRVLA